MPTYLVTGFDPDGSPRSEPVEAADPDSAMEAVDFYAQDATLRKDLDGKKLTRPAKLPQRSRPILSKNRAASGVAKSDFIGLVVASMVLRTMGVIAVLLALMALIQTLSSDHSRGFGYLLGQAIPVIVMFLFGSLVYGAGEACAALRVIAINSYAR